MTPLPLNLLDAVQSAVPAPLTLLADVEREGQAGLWLPEAVGNHAAGVDFLFLFITWVCVFFVILIGGLMVLFAWKLRQKPEDRGIVKKGWTHNTPLELAWTIPPLLIVLFIFLVGFRGYVDMAVDPDANTFEVDVEGYQWGWTFTYPNGGQTGGASALGDGVELHIPADRNVEFVLAASDVLHSFYVPAMRLKKDCVPGRYNRAWVNVDSAEHGIVPGKPMTVPMHCTEYCGKGHSQMNGVVIIHHPDSYFNGTGMPDGTPVLEQVNRFPSDKFNPVELGEWVHGNFGGCAQCHSVDGTGNSGPTWKNIYSQERDGKPVDDAYLLESIYYPGRYIVPGYTNAMPRYKNKLNYGHIRGLLEYMKTLTDGYEGPILEEWPGGAEYDGKAWITATGEEAAPPIE